MSSRSRPRAGLCQAVVAVAHIRGAPSACGIDGLEGRTALVSVSVSFTAVHGRPSTTTGSGLRRYGRCRPLLNIGLQTWKACWGQPLAGSNPASSAPLTRAFAVPVICSRRLRTAPGLILGLICGLREPPPARAASAARKSAWAPAGSPGRRSPNHGSPFRELGGRACMACLRVGRLHLGRVDPPSEQTEGSELLQSLMLREVRQDLMSCGISHC